ncbi:nitrate/nitrite sensing protein [Nocardioides albertanoniae]|uniref:Nitrate/nitrite sensing protein n=1 Tax=Nocardioides albertanoniae TaxID=1175486 RepID=A0A543A3D1_9ACTN|nr:nitrate- and nitrite sensing domain-containing protein [Nocardioides albertanoniae]TQL67095.1 nitrate/nitrite sensing protein [Nocardioides albertanoniae]
MTQIAEPTARDLARKRPWWIWVALAVVLLLAVAAAVVGGSGISRALAAEEDARQAESVAEALPETYAVASSLLSERDGRLAGVPPVVMRPLQEATDVTIKAWLSAARAIDTDGDEELGRQVADIRGELNGIDDLREQLRKKATRSEAARRYTDLTTSLFGLPARMPSLGEEADDTRSKALADLGAAWVALGQERSIMAALVPQEMAAGPTQPSRAGDRELAALAEAEATWRTSLGDFYAHTSDEQRHALDQLTDGTAEEGAVGTPAQQAVGEVIDGGLGKVAATPGSYFSSVLDLTLGLQRISAGSAEEVSADAAQIRQDASTTALMIVIGVVCVVVVLLVVALVLLVLGIVLSRRRV